MEGRDQEVHLRAELQRLQDEKRDNRRTIAMLEALVESLRSSLEAQQAAYEAQQTAFQDQTRALEKVLAELQSIQRRFLGPKPERMPSPKEEAPEETREVGGS